jgi:adenylate cyclase
MSEPLPERALLWADVSEFTRAMEASEPQMAQSTHLWVDRCVRGWLPELRGEFLQQAGDAILLAFQHPEQALRAGHRLQQDWHALAPRIDTGTALPLRIALHWGNVWPGPQGYVAHSLNQLARLAQQVTPGDIWASDQVWQRLPDPSRRDSQDLGWMHFKHLAQPLRVFRLNGPPSPPLDWTEPTRIELPRLLVCARLPHGTLAWAQQWVNAMHTQGFCLASAVAWAGGPENVAHLMHHTRADFLLRRSTHGRQSVVELLAAPRALVLQRWLTDADDTQAHTDRHGPALLKAMQAHSTALALSMGPQALSTGLLRMATLHLMHSGSPQQAQPTTDFLQAWAQREPKRAEPWVYRAQWEVMRHTRGPEHGDAELALHHADQALRLETDSAQAWAVRGFARTHLQGDPERGLRDLEQAAERPRAQPWTGLYRSVALSLLGQAPAAHAQATQAMLQPPVGSPRAYAWGLVGHATLLNQQIAVSLRWLLASWRAQRHHAPTLRMLVVAHQMLDQTDMAAFFLRELMALDPGFTARNYLGRTRAGHGLRAELAHWLMRAGLPMK